jgi:NAD-dependent dihydropyrimidine dehydrogenase PreA subunit
MTEKETMTPNSEKFTRRDKTFRIISKILRWVILGSLLAFVISATILHVLGEAAPSIHAICPYGGLESLLSIVTIGTFVKKIFLGTFILFIVTLVMAIVLRRSFCGQICPFGGLQEFFAKLGQKIFRKRLTIPRKLDRVLRYLKYAVLLLTVAMSWLTAELWITPYDPYNALGHLADWNTLTTTYLAGFILLIVTALGSLLFDRFFCKYLCPAGALYGIIGKISPYAVRVNKGKCIRCGLCDSACPMNVRVMDCKKGKVTDIECINCNECVNACPKKGAISTGFSRKAILHPIIAIIVTLTLFFIPILVSKAFGYYQVLPNKFTQEQSIGTGTGEGQGDACEETGGTINGVSSGDIKGYLTLNDVSRILAIPPDELLTKLGLPADFPLDYEMKSAAEYLNMEMSGLKAILFK